MADAEQVPSTPRTVMQPAASRSLIPRRSRGTERTAIRAQKALDSLNEAWGSKKWVPPDQFTDHFMIDGDRRGVNRRGVNYRILSFKELFYLAKVTETAKSHGLDLPSMWKEGGFLYDAMAQRDAGCLRWLAKHTAKDAWVLCQERYGVCI
ncbi:hypothetical protein CONLIGDRAFT_685890 [Coniochaeta ligniaria NRRL 30616]|uniref:Uncharacterized protein n=1 Tax=Coniochaeta ligniaria NRRL 30616 TaxID=1408157 RepID=A0A1J7J548_9PEZI|nr:hypothetical protein CONLIGDRAFT_685890 [Coniochaeta ligniaria NRRL 30616]